MRNRLKHSLCYLSGSMDMATDGGIEWRIRIEKELRDLGVGVLNPCDKPTLEGVEDPQTREIVRGLKNDGKFEDVQKIMKEIVRCDLRMVDIANFLILKITPEVHMCGSYHEMVVGVQQRKPILVVCEQGRKHIPNWIFGIVPTEHMFDNFETMFKYLEYIDTSASIDTIKRWHFFNYDKVFNLLCQQEN